MFAVDPTNGKLNFTSKAMLKAGSNARKLSRDPSGHYLLVASQDANSIKCFHSDYRNGTLQGVDSQGAPAAADMLTRQGYAVLRTAPPAIEKLVPGTTSLSTLWS